MNDDKIRYIRASDEAWKALKQIAFSLRTKMGHALEEVVDFYAKEKGIKKRRSR